MEIVFKYILQCSHALVCLGPVISKSVFTPLTCRFQRISKKNIVKTLKKRIKKL